MKRIDSEVHTKETASLEKSVAKDLTKEDRDMDEILEGLGIEQEKETGDENTE